MTTKTTTAKASKDTADRLAEECAAARAAVIANPADEAAAEQLFDVVSRASREPKLTTPVETRRPHGTVAQAARLLERGEEEKAEILLRRHLVVVPNDPDAMLLMADIAVRCGFPENADKILRRSVELHPDRTDNLIALAKFLHRRARRLDTVALVDDAIRYLDQLLAIVPDHEEALRYKGAVLVQIRRLDEARATFEQLLNIHPYNSHGWADLAHIHKTVGRFGEAVAGFRTALALDPTNGPAWSMLSDMKLARFFASDIERLKAAIEQPQNEQHTTALHFALAAAYHHARDYENAAAHLRVGNARRLEMHPHDIDRMENAIETAKRVYTPKFFVEREAVGHPSDDPIFVVGMPRSGSTLVEQILSSHPSIEGTAELPAVLQIEGELIGNPPSERFIDELVEGLPADKFDELGGRYLELTRFHRRTDRTRFTDKYPGNWRQVGLIHAMLPNAKIIDIRRDPMDCCFANYSQHFANGVNYSYGLREMASQYRQYVGLMRHFDEVLPDRIHRVIYEDLVENTEAEVRRMLDYLGLSFDEKCLRFFETERAIHTPSSEQVRQPINRSGIGKWRLYEPWLGELKDALGQTIEDWR